MTMKPVMSAEIERRLLNALSSIRDRVQWRAWGLDKIRKMGQHVLLYGPPGGGKTVIAEWFALQGIKKGLREVSFADFGSKVPGENARQLRIIFKEAREKGNQTLFFDECDAVLVSRDHLGSDMKWMLEIINEILMQVGKYPGTVIFSTNRMPEIDPALDRRLIAKIHVGIPEFPERVQLWKQKWPKTYPLAMTPHIAEQLAQYVLTGAEIESAIIDVSSDAIRRKVKPTIEDFCNVAKQREIKGVTS